MITATEILTADVPTGSAIVFMIAGLREGDLDMNTTGALAIDDVPWPEVTFAIDFFHETIKAFNTSATAIPAGTTAVLSWEGVAIEKTVTELTTRVAAVEADVTDLTARVAAVEVDVTDLMARVVALEAAVASLQEVAADHEVRIATNTDRITVLEALATGR